VLSERVCQDTLTKQNEALQHKPQYTSRLQKDEANERGSSILDYVRKTFDGDNLLFTNRVGKTFARHDSSSLFD